MSGAVSPTGGSRGRGSLRDAIVPKAHDAYQAMHRAIREGQLPPGARLKEVELAQQLGMSRTPIREAIRKLERDGVVTVLANRGAVVRMLSGQEIDDTYSLRAVLEGYCASRAAVCMDRAALYCLEEVQAELERRIGGDGTMEAESAIEALIRLNRAFHEAIHVGCQNSRVGETLQKATEVPIHMKQLYWRSNRARAGALAHHRQILDALWARDAVRADAAMLTHVYAVKEFFVRQHRGARIHRLGDDGSPVADATGKWPLPASGTEA